MLRGAVFIRARDFLNLKCMLDDRRDDQSVSRLSSQRARPYPGMARLEAAVVIG